jgi:hypothetical protein
MAAFEQLEHELFDVVADHDDIEFVTEALLMTAYNLNKSCEIINKILQQWEVAEFPGLSVLLKFGIVEMNTDEHGEVHIQFKDARAKAYTQAAIDLRARKKIRAFFKARGVKI